VVDGGVGYLITISDKAQHMGDITPETQCSFNRQASDQEHDILSGVGSGSALGAEEEVAAELLETTASNDVLKLWPWVNQVTLTYLPSIINVLSRNTLKTPLTVPPRLPLEILMQLFKRMGYINIPFPFTQLTWLRTGPVSSWWKSRVCSKAW